MASTVCLGRALTTPPLVMAVRCAAGKRTVSTSYSTKTRRNKTNTVDGKKGSKRTESTWQCASGCGACCKLAKGPAFPSPEEIFSDDPDNLQVFLEILLALASWHVGLSIWKYNALSCYFLFFISFDLIISNGSYLRVSLALMAGAFTMRLIQGHAPFTMVCVWWNASIYESIKVTQKMLLDSLNWMYFILGTVY